MTLFEDSSLQIPAFTQISVKGSGIFVYLCFATLSTYACFLDLFILVYLEELSPTIIWSISRYLCNDSQMAEHLGAVLWFMGTLFSTMWLDGLKKILSAAHVK